MCETCVYRMTCEQDDIQDECEYYAMADGLETAEREYLEDLAMRCKYYQDFLEEEGWED